MTLTLLAAAGFVVLLFGAGLIWIRILAPRLEFADQVAGAPAVAVVYFGAVTTLGLVVPWSFRVNSVLGMFAWLVGAIVLGWRRARPGLGIALRRSWTLVVPMILGFLAVAAFGAVQGDPAGVVAMPGTLVSARVTNLPPDHLFPVGTAQVLQHRGDLTKGRYFGGWDFADRTPLAGAFTASVLSATGTTLPRTLIWKLPTKALHPQVQDTYGYWVAHLVLALLNASVIVAIGRLALSIFGGRAATIAGLLAASNPYVFTHLFFTWPKMLAAYFVLLHYVLVRERRMPLVAGALAGLAYLAHPLAALFVVPSLAVVVARGLRRGGLAVAGFVGAIAPWSLWSSVEAHPSRMLTYPLGYTIRDPSHLGRELSTAWRRFENLGGFSHALRVRYDEIVGTLIPVNVARNFATLPGGCDCITSAEAWFTVHDRTLPGMALFVMTPFVTIGLYRWWRVARGELLWMLIAPLGLALAFWGVAARGLGADLLQPTGAVLIVVAAGALTTVKRSFALIGVVLAIVESASVVWWSLFAELAGTRTPTVVVAVIVWTIPCLLLVMAVIHTDREARTWPPPAAHRRPAT